MKPPAGKIALITGASRGLGKAMALALAEAGARLALVSRDGKALEQAASEARALGAEAEAFPCDVSQEDQVSALESRVIERFGKLHILINNAGINIRKPVTEFTLEEWRRVIDTNLTAAFLMVRAFLPHMRGHGYGRIINITSTLSHVALPLRTAYASSKAGLLGFTRALALELAPEGITVVGISPGPFATEINRPLLEDPAAGRDLISRVPLGRWGRLEEVGRLAVYLCTEEAAYITGSDILIDGGWCAQ